MEKCMYCKKPMRIIKKAYVRGMKQNIEDWETRSLHKKCWLERMKREEMVDYLKHKGYLDKNRIYIIEN